MSTVHFGAIAVLLGLWSAAGALAQQAGGPLKPFKDELFSAQTVLETRDSGDFKRIDYQELRDINERDETPERRVKSRYVDLGTKRQQQDEVLDFGTWKLPVTRIGAAQGQRFTVIFIHGRGGDRRLGANDFTFGGNFNRLKNLAVANGGSYYAPSVATFDANGVAQVAALIDHAKKQSGGAPVILSCASMGSFICWGMTREQQAVGQLAGMTIMGGATDPDFKKSLAFKKKLPIFFTHGSRDSVYKAEDQVALYDGLHKIGYPTRFTLFETGSHGTPVRMSDWRDMLNWVLTRR